MTRETARRSKKDALNVVVNGRYRLIDVLGDGAQGTVFKAVDLTGSQRKLALKMMRMNAPGALLRFEFSTLARLEHPHLIKVYDLGLVEQVEGVQREPLCAGTPFFTQEYVSAESAEIWIQSVSPEQRALSIARVGIAVSRALALLHSNGLLHRDIKPSNILVGDGAQVVKVIDLGFTRSRRTDDRSLSGTLAFMAPEAIDGYPGVRSDLYSLGVTLAQLLTEEPAALGRPQAVEAPPHVPAKLWAVVRRLLSVRADRRYGSAKETATALARAVGSRGLGFGTDIPVEANPDLQDGWPRPQVARSSDLIGRHKEQQAIVSWLRQSFDRQSETTPVAVLSGPAGVGKTRLFRSAVHRVQIDLVESAAAPPSLLEGSLKELLLKKGPVEDVSETLLSKWLRGQGSRAKSEHQTEFKQHHLLREMGDALLAVDHPSIMLIKDEDNNLTEQLLERLAAEPVEPGRAPVAVVIERRTDPAVRLTSTIEHWPIAPLSAEGEAQLVNNVLQRSLPPPTMGAVHARTGGVPLLTEAMLSAIIRQGNPARLDERDFAQLDLPGDPQRLLLAGLTSGLPPHALALTQALSILGEPADVEQLMAVAAIEDLDEAVHGLRTLVRRGLLIETTDERFTLPGLIGDALVNSLGEKVIRTLHQRAFVLFKNGHRPDPRRLARHATRAKMRKRSVHWSRQAADLLISTGDLFGAAAHLEALLEWSADDDEQQLLASLELARVYRLIGRYDKAIELAEFVAQCDEQHRDRALLECAAAMRLSGKNDAALKKLSSPMAAADGELSLRARGSAARILFDQGKLAEASKTLNETHLDKAKPTVLVSLLSTVGLIALGLGQSERALALFTAGSQVAREMGDQRAEARYLGLIGMADHAVSDFENAARHYQSALTIADRAGDRHGAATYAVNLAAAFSELDRTREALQSYRDGLNRLKHQGRPEELSLAQANFANLLLRLGDVEAAEQVSARAVETAEQAGPTRAVAMALCIRGEVLIAANRLDEAQPALERAEKLALELDATVEQLASTVHLCAVAIKRGRAGTAISTLDRIAAPIAEQSDLLRLEHQRLRLEAALAGGGDPLVELESLMELLTAPGARRRTDHLPAALLAAQTADEMQQTAWARTSAAIALELISYIRLATPALHRPPDLEEIEQQMSRMAPAARPDHAASPTDPQSPTVQRWQRLLRINTRLNSEFRISHLLDLIMDTAVEITDAERGFLLIANPSGKLGIRCARNIDRESLDADEQHFSRSVTLRAFETGEPVLTTNAQEDERFQSVKSVLNLNLRYILAVPLNVRGRSTGAIYVDSKLKGRFDDERVSMLTMLADQAAIALTNARLTAENKDRQRHIEQLNEQLAEQLAHREGELAEVKQELALRTDEMITRYRYDGIVAQSAGMKKVFQLLDRVIDTDLPVIIQGESGTGKELIARAIHFNGARKKKSFVVQNCAAIPEPLLESTLFGHVRGAFTGAVKDTAGMFVQADGGTLFLDEIGEMPLAMQTRLLRVLQNGEVRPVGGTKTFKVDVRIVVASNASLATMVQDNAFREDLYYRLNVISVFLPPLRERREDIPILARHFLAKHGGQQNRAFSKSAMEQLMRFDWPGNVRHLENEIMRAIVLSDGEVSIDHLSEEVIIGTGEGPSAEGDLDMNGQVDHLKRRLIVTALRRTGGNQSGAAKLLGLSRYGLQKMIARLEIPLG